MLAIGLCSLFALSVVLLKAITLRRKNVIPEDTNRAIKSSMDIDQDGEQSLQLSLQAEESPLGRIAKAASDPRISSREEAVTAAQTSARSEVVKLEGGIPALEVVITIAPLLGLLGTVGGLVGVFGALGDSVTDADPKKLASGIAQALGTTIAGLVVAVPTVIAHSYFNRKIEQYAVEMEETIGAMLSWLHPASPNRFRGGTNKSPAPTFNELAEAVATTSSEPTQESVVRDRTS